MKLYAYDCLIKEFNYMTKLISFLIKEFNSYDQILKVCSLMSNLRAKSLDLIKESRGQFVPG